MTLNCLACQVLERKDSDAGERDSPPANHTYEKLSRPSKQAQKRNWSGNLAPTSRNYDEQAKRGSGTAEVKKLPKLGHRRLYSTGGLAFEGTAEPRLLRSSGMRRDWSFENLRERDDNKYLLERIC